jgi:flavin reductase (DIM6/NTAB) family NADH-FMN oxidoreductase RutF
MVSRDLDAASPREVYRLLSSVVIPRPIAWILTRSPEGRLNLAPFSSFMGIFGPPLLAVAFGRRRDGSLKDTHRNLRETGEAVVHLGEAPLLEALHASGEDLPPEVSEVERLSLAVVPSDRVAPPRLKEASVALECRLRSEEEVGPSTTLVLLHVLRLHAATAIWREDWEACDPDRWEPVARLGSLAGPNYAWLGKRLRLEGTGRPKGPSGKNGA